MWSACTAINDKFSTYTYAAVTTSQAQSASLAKYCTSTSGSSERSNRQGFIVCSATAASTRGIRRSSIFATVNFIFGTCSAQVGR